MSANLQATPRRVFITGGTGYIGSRVIPELTNRGHAVTALVRDGSQRKIAANCQILLGDALNGESYANHLGSFDTFIQLVGVAHPNPSKAHQFVEVDQRSGSEAIRVAKMGGIQHFIYLSVAHPAPVMKAYIEARSTCEKARCGSGLNATILQPWYVLGPGHRWPVILSPLYWIAQVFPATRKGAARLGFLTLRQMVNVIAWAVDNPAFGIRVLSVPDIRAKVGL